jgi:hypothetical protein
MRTTQPFPATFLTHMEPKKTAEYTPHPEDEPAQGRLEPPRERPPGEVEEEQSGMDLPIDEGTEEIEPGEESVSPDPTRP